jgi:Flp pilus assembly protein TadB
MSPSSSQSWTRRIRPGYNENIRVSDAERAEVADRLAAHYGDGRLDKAEFDERVSHAMSAKTRGDLNGLFDDLPDFDDHGRSTATGPAEPVGAGGAGGAGGVSGPTRQYGVSQRGRAHPILAAAVLIFVAIVAWHALIHLFFIPWFAIVIVVAIVMLVNRGSRRTRRDRL